MDRDERDHLVRIQAFQFLEQQAGQHGSAIPHRVLVQGFVFDGTRVPLLGPQGIFKPAVLDLPLSITTAPLSRRKARSYDDELGDDGIIRYRYRGTDSQHPDNRGLRRCMAERKPLAYLHGIHEALYEAFWPVLVVGDDVARLTFEVQVAGQEDLAMRGSAQPTSAEQIVDMERRRYATVLAKRRIHQDSFRLRVIFAYRQRCSVCRLREEVLLDAAHILPDSKGGLPVVSNGLSLCSIHHRAFDRNLVGVTPELRIEVHPRILRAKDGPMLLHGLQQVHGEQLLEPRRADEKPDRELLRGRYHEFRLAQ
jgi:putative restriction endonuclease